MSGRARATPGMRLAAGAATLAGLLLLAGCAGSGAEAVADVTTTATATTDPGAGAADGFQDPDLGTSESNATRSVTPTRVSVPVIGVESGLETLGLEDDGRIAPPVDWDSAGWYENGVVPGDVGPAVLAGHVDSPTGPAVFGELSTLAAGDEVIVTMSDGAALAFTVDRALRASKADFPTSEVYAPTPTPQLRLITCDGDWDPATGHYADNLVVFASLASSPAQR